MGILIAPLITEKQTDITEAKSTRYGFKVQYSADKSDIRKAVEETYGVTVLKVNTMRYSGKKESRYTKHGFVEGRKPAYKKAIVTIAEGETIDFFGNI